MLRAFVFCLLAGCLCTQGRSNTIIIDFESFLDGDIVTNQIPGLTFTNTSIATAGISLNEFDFPPHSGSNVAIDNGGPISILFGSPVTDFGAYFTYIQPLTLVGFGAMNAQVANAMSSFSNNTGTGGDVGSSPNEFIHVSFAGGISSVTIEGAPTGSSFAMDDVTLTTGMIPEPPTGYLALSFVGAWPWLRRLVRS